MTPEPGGDFKGPAWMAAAATGLYVLIALVLPAIIVALAVVYFAAVGFLLFRTERRLHHKHRRQRGSS